MKSRIIILAASAGFFLGVVELFKDNPLLPRVIARGVGVVMGSMDEEVVLRRAGLAGARRFLALANDDILNINAATVARRLNRARSFTAVAQISDARLRENLPASLAREITFLNPFERIVPLHLRGTGPRV
jgi:Trk K+ transport system NAD-binding subunit